MIYTDGKHIIATTLKELHQFANRVGLKREWFQEHSKHPHYDITTKRMLNKILSNGVAVITSNELVYLSNYFSKMMSCGHQTFYVVQDKEGTAYCSKCEEEASESARPSIESTD